ncbi:hypothetical protein VB712_05325 [Spirulina sp. CCNP1310]|nr:hypothetical protein [Spirulina sp. CCNP1310]MEA5418640.1 hypothetical protein [Spirulina sp. CCNP1310]
MITKKAIASLQPHRLTTQASQPSFPVGDDGTVTIFLPKILE